MSSNDHDDVDPFAGYGLPADSDRAEGVASQQKHTGDRIEQATHRMPPVARGQPSQPASWIPLAFEVQPRKGFVSCEDCFHYVEGGALAIDQIYEIDQAGLFDFAIECKDFEKSFEVRELQQIVEKAKTLDERFDGRPRIRGHCAAAQVDSDQLYLIPEIKNHDGYCGDFLAGRRPFVRCDKCAHHQEATLRTPSKADYGVDYGSFADGIDPDTSAEAMGSFLNAMRHQYRAQDAYHDRDEQKFAQKLRDDISEAIYNDRSPDHYTIDYCRKLSFKACAVLNRSNRCTHFKSKEEQEEEQQIAKMGKGAAEFITEMKAGDSSCDRSHKNFLRWFNLKNRDKSYADEIVRAEERQKQRRMERRDAPKPAPAEQADIPCFGCGHKRDPVNVDPFTKVHFVSPDIMNVRDEYKRERKMRQIEERRICAQPGASLGDSEAPSLHIWCDHYSRKQADGQIQEYAYCYRALKAMAADGVCPSFLSREAAAQARSEESEKTQQAKEDERRKRHAERFRKLLDGALPKNKPQS